MNRVHLKLPSKITKHDVMSKIKDLCRNGHFAYAFNYSRNLIKYSNYNELIVIYGALAVKFNHSLLKYVNKLSLVECANLIDQYVGEHFEELNIHETSCLFISFVLNVLVVRLLTNRVWSNSKLSTYLKMWIDQNTYSPDFIISMRKFISLADRCAPQNLFIIFGTLHAYNFESKYYSLDLKWELIVRAITYKLNCFEEMKLKPQLNVNDLLIEEKKLSKLYIQLTHFCRYNAAVQFELLLTAFSLYPHRDVYDVIKERRNNRLNDWPNEMLSGRIFNPIDGCTMNDELHHQLGTDIITILMEPRNKFIKSDLEWPILDNNLCQLLNQQYKMNFVRNYQADANLHLKYLNLDYSQFRKLDEEYLEPMDDQDVHVVDSTIEVINGDVYGLNRFVKMTDIRTENQLLPSVFIVPLHRNIENWNKNYICIKRTLSQTLKGSRKSSEMKRKKYTKVCG